MKLTEMNVTDDVPNTLFRGYLMNKKFHDRDLILEIAGIGIRLYRRSFGSEEIMNYILATGYAKTLNANTQIDLQYRDSDGDFADFAWATDLWINNDRDVGLIIKDQTEGFTSIYWDCKDPIAQANGVVQLGDFESTHDYDDADYYSVRDSTSFNMTITPTMEGVVIADTNKLKSIELEYSFRLRVNAGAAWTKATVRLQIKKDTIWITIDQVYAQRYLGTHTTGWVQALDPTLKEEDSPYIITEGGDDSELQKYFNEAGGNYTELKEMRFIITGTNEGYGEIHVDYLRAKITYHDFNVLPVMKPITDSDTSWVACATVANWQQMGVTVNEDAFQIGENTNQIIQDIMSQAGLDFEISTPASFTKYMARKFKGNHCIEPLKAVCDLEGAEWFEDYINNRIVIIKQADYIDSAVDLTQANYEHEWEFEDQCNQVKYVYVWGKTSINEVGQLTINIFAKAVSATATGNKSMQIVNDNIMTQPEAQTIADTQLALLEAKRPSIRIPLEGVNITLQLGTYVGLTMARPTVAAADYNIRMIQRYKRGKTGIQTVIYCGMGETEWDEKLIKEIQRLQLETHRALTDRLESTPYDVGVGGIIWDDIGGRTAGVEAIITAELVNGQSIDNKIDTLIAASGHASIATGTYTGNGANNRQITGLGFTPLFLIIYQHQAAASMYTFVNHDDFGAWDTLRVSGETFYDDGNISTIIADGFEVNNNEATDWANINGKEYYWVAWG